MNELYYIDEQTFLEQWLPDYGHNDDVAAMDDIDKVLDNDYEPDDEFVQEYLNTPLPELRNERVRIARKLMERAFKNYIETEYKEQPSVKSEELDAWMADFIEGGAKLYVD